MFAVDAAFFASDKDTDEGSFCSDVAVLRAACFCAHVVPPPVGEVVFPEGAVPPVLKRAKRF